MELGVHGYIVVLVSMILMHGAWCAWVYSGVGFHDLNGWSLVYMAIKAYTYYCSFSAFINKSCYSAHDTHI